MSKIKLSDISKFIDIREERYSISKESVSLLQSFLDQNLMFESSKSIFTCFCRSTYPIYNCLGIKQREIDEYNQISNILTLQITKNIYTQQSVSMLTHQFFLINDISRIYNKEILIQISKIIIDIFQRNKKNNSFFNNEINFILIHILVVISFKSEDNELINYITSLLLLDEIDINTKLLIFYCIPAYIHFIPSYNNLKVSDESFAFSIISNNKKNPAIIKNAFYWLALLFNNSKEKLDSHQKFILTVFKGIGQSFVAKSCLFIDDSFDQKIHNEVSHSMISFIRLLYNKNNTDLFELIHDILQNKIQNIENDDMFISIGLFISFGQNLSGKEIQKKYMPSFQFTKSIEQYGYIKKAVLLENKNIELNEKEIDNILKLHDVFIHSNCLNGHQKYEGAIDDNEINKSILIASFYSFLPIIMQITNNARILMNDSNINRTLSIFDLATKPIPSNINSISELSKMLSSAILETTLQNEIKFCDSIKFMKMNYGEVVYANGEGNDIIKTNKNHFNIFICNRPFDFECETYFEICPHGDGWKKVFIGFIDSEDSMFDKAFGFGCIGNNEVFCKKSPHLAQILNIAADDVMKKEQIDENKFMFKEGNKIGCYFTSEYSYLTINGNLTPYRLSNKSLKSYFPVIITDHVNIEIEITKNISIVNESDFLGIKFVPKGFFEKKDINIYCIESISWTYRQPNSDNSYSDFPLIGCKANALLLPYNDSDIETIDVYPKDLLDLYLKRGVIKDMIPLKDNPFVSKYIVEFFNHKKVMHQKIQIDSRSLFIKGTSFMNMVGRLTGADFVFNELNMKCLPNLLTLRSYLNLNDLKKYMINKIINDNSKSIAIIMTKYLSFILIDYLRYSKSKLLQDEEINSKEMQIIIKSLAHSLPTITEFQPSFELPIDDTIKNKYIIFPDEKVVNDNFINNVYEELNQQLVFKTPGDSYMFNYSFKIFLNKSQNNISTRFLSILMKEIFDNTKNKSLSLTQIYDLIPSYHKLESISPLPDYYSINIDNLLNEINLIGAILLLFHQFLIIYHV